MENMEWIKSNEHEPLIEGKYFCKYNNVKLILEFVKIKPKREHYVINENFKEDMLNEIKFWTKDINGSTHIEPCEDLLWLEEKIADKSDEKSISSEITTKKHCTHLTISRHYGSFGREYGYCIHCNTEFYL